MFPTVTSNIKDLSTALKTSKIETEVKTFSAFLKFDFTSGKFFCGKDADDVSGMSIIVNTYSISHGWTLWSGGKPTKVSAPFTAALPEQIPPIGKDESTESRSFQAVFAEGGEAALTFDTNSYGGRKATDTLLSIIKNKAMEGESKYLFPEVLLSSESYKHSGGKTIHNPVFKVDQWLDVDGNPEPE
jgi:hypothetical protein